MLAPVLRCCLGWIALVSVVCVDGGLCSLPAVRRQCNLRWVSQGAFSHSARTAPIITLFILGTPLKTAPLQKHA